MVTEMYTREKKQPARPAVEEWYEWGGLLNVQRRNDHDCWLISLMTYDGPEDHKAQSNVSLEDAAKSFFFGSRRSLLMQVLRQAYAELALLMAAPFLEVLVGGALSHSGLKVRTLTTQGEPAASMDLRHMLFLMGDGGLVSTACSIYKSEDVRADEYVRYHRDFGFREGGEQALANLLERHIAVYDIAEEYPFHPLSETRRDFYPQAAG